MFIYLITLKSGKIVRVESEGDPSEAHPSLFGRIVDVKTIGEVGKHLSLV